jgi:glycosyltransferase involved in cell wall biosynthesis
LSGGGAERFVSTCLVHLDRARFEPALALVRGEVSYPLPDDVTVEVLGKRRVWHGWRAVRRLAAVIERLQPQVVASALGFCNVLVAAALRRSAWCPFWIARSANHPAYEGRGLRRRQLRRAYGAADRVVANSHGLAEAVAAAYPEVRDKLDVVGNPTDFERIDRLAGEPAPLPPASCPTVIAVGRLSRQKRPDRLLAAFARTRERMPARLVLCGEGPRERTVRRQGRRLGIGDDVRLPGFCHNPYAWMARSDLFVLSSDYEGLPNALIEAQGLGLPAVTMNCPCGPGEIVEDGVTGLLVEPSAGPEALAEAMVALLTNPERRSAFGRAARDRARSRYGLEAVMETWQALLAEGAEHHRLSLERAR